MPAELPFYVPWIKPAVMVLLLGLLWSWESLHPFVKLFGRGGERRRHALRNLAITLVNTLVLAVLFGLAIVAVARWTEEHCYGLLNALPLPRAVQWLGALLLLDGWLYLWHRLNHRIPFLWRFHRMHHSDPQMDVTTATRFHLGEHVLATILRLGLIPLFGVTLLQILIYDTLVIANTLLHHANISYGRLDPLLRALIVTPAMHKVHHSRLRPETDSNYSTIFSIWDRLARSFRLRDDGSTIRFGLDEFDEPGWQTFTGMLKTPLANRIRSPDGRPSRGDPELASAAAADRPTDQSVSAAD